MDLTALDWILLLVLLYFAVSGYLRGFFLTLGSVVGFVLGAVAAFYLVPLAVELASGGWRVVVAIISLLVLIGLGQALGLAVARGLMSVMHGTLVPEDTPGGGLTMVIELPVATRGEP